MWSPTHVQVTVQRAKGLLTKGKNSTNNCFVTIALGKEKYQTSVRDKASQNVEWHEECELAIPDKGNTAELILTCLHHNNLGIDEFLGQITLPLRDMDAYDRPRSKWFKLQSKPGQEKKDKERGELEVRINFTVKAGSLTDLSKKEKHKSSFTQLASSVGGSLLSIGTLEKKKGFKKIATSIGSKLHLVGKKKDKKDGGGDNDSFNGSTASIGTPNSSLGGSRKWNGRQYLGNTDPGVPEDDDSIYDQTSRRSSNHSNPDIKITQDTTNPSSPASMQNELKTSYNTNQMGANKTLSVRNSWGKSRVYLPIPEKSEPETNKNGAENERFEFDDGEVVFRAKGEPILNENRNSQVLDIPESHKAKPRKFLPNRQGVDDDFNLDNLSCNSSPYSSMTSQSYCDYNDSNDSGRSSKIFKTEEGEDDLNGSFDRADSRRRASRKKYFAPTPKEREIEKQLHDNVKVQEKLSTEKDEIIIDFQPQEKTSKPEVRKMEVEPHALGETYLRNVPKNIEDIVPVPKVRTRINLENTYSSPTLVRSKEEDISVECQNIEKYQKTEVKNIASSNIKAQVFETRSEEKIQHNCKVVEIKEMEPASIAEISNIEITPKYEAYNESLTDRHLGGNNNKVSNLTIQLGTSYEKGNMEIVGARNNLDLEFSENREDNEIYSLELRKSTGNVEFEIRDMKRESISSDEMSSHRISVSNIRNMFEQNSTTKDSALISPRHSFRRSIRNEEKNIKKNFELEKTYEVNLNSTKIIPCNREKIFKNLEMEHYAVETTPIQVFERANVLNMNAESLVRQNIETCEEENFAIVSNYPEIFENTKSQSIALESNIAQIFERATEENIALKYNVSEVLNKVEEENIAVETYLGEILDRCQEENTAIECNFSEIFERANLEYTAIESNFAERSSILTDESIATEFNIATAFENVYVEHIAVESYMPQSCDIKKEENVAAECSLKETYENAVAENVVKDSQFIKILEQREQQYFASKYNIVEVIEPLVVKNIAVQQNILEILEEQENKISEVIPLPLKEYKEVNIVKECNIAEAFENLQIKNVAEEKQIAQVFDKKNEENFAVECNIFDLSESLNSENVAVESSLLKIEFIPEFKDIELNKEEIDRKTMNLLTTQEPQSPVTPFDDNLTKSSSNILQIAEIEEDSIKYKENIPKISSVAEISYENLQSKPEIKTNIKIESNENHNNNIKLEKSKIIESIEEMKKPIPKPRNSHKEELNDLYESSSSANSSLEHFNIMNNNMMPNKVGNQDPGVIEDDDEFVFDKLSHKSSGSSLNIRGHNEYNNQHRVPSPVITKEEDNFRTSTKISLAAAPPAKPPRNASDQKLDEWESKLYGNHLEIGSSDSLKRRSWGNNRIPLNTAEETEEDYEDVKLSSSSNNVSNNNSSSTSATTDVFTDVNKTSQDNFNKSQQPSNDNINVTEKHLSDINKVDKIEKLIDENNSIIAVNQTTSPSDTTATTSVIDDLQKSEKKESKIEKLFNKSPLLKQQTREKLHDIDLQNNRNSGKMKPKLLPRSDTIAEFNDDVIRNIEDTKEIRERLKKDQKEISEKTEKIEKKNRFAKFKYFNKRMDSKADVIEEMHGERHNPIGHENFNDNQNSLPELSPELLNKYDGKSREDIILIADSLEKEMITERNRVKELEEYLDNLLLRVMETHPKILQNPYRTASTKSG